MFASRYVVRMHDSDMAGIIFFANQFRFVHDTWEDFIESEGIGLAHIFKDSDYFFVIVHAEGDYIAPLCVGDNLEVALTVEHIGTSSFSCHYDVLRLPDRELVGKAKIVHVTLDATSRKKIPIPPSLQAILEKHKT